jgi:hypothetical protein
MMIKEKQWIRQPLFPAVEPPHYKRTSYFFTPIIIDAVIAASTFTGLPSQTGTNNSHTREALQNFPNTGTSRVIRYNSVSTYIIALTNSVIDVYGMKYIAIWSEMQTMP